MLFHPLILSKYFYFFVQIVREVLTREKSEPKILESFGNNFGLFRVKALIKKNIRVCSRDYL